MGVWPSGSRPRMEAVRQRRGYGASVAGDLQYLGLVLQGRRERPDLVRTALKVGGGARWVPGPPVRTGGCAGPRRGAGRARVRRIRWRRRAAAPVRCGCSSRCSSWPGGRPRQARGQGAIRFGGRTVPVRFAPAARRTSPLSTTLSTAPTSANTAAIEAGSPPTGLARPPCGSPPITSITPVTDEALRKAQGPGSGRGRRCQWSPLVWNH